MVCKGCGSNCKCTSTKCGDNCACDQDCKCACKSGPKDKCCTTKAK
ncbi:GL23465 [Drosophila persimilis]|uniref:GL23465 n=1 Tax=Drosophila persimilis TaxID=7234 RepID=B4G3E8_DROPE|nr:metallothionein-3 [Drosophila persimilis]EDW24330.1 GL23465 [Drosophila persimilis]